MLSACQLLLMRRTRGRAIDIAIAPIGTVISQTQTSGGAYSGVSVMLGSRLSLDRFAEWIERRSWPVQSWLWALSCYAAAAHPSIQRNARYVAVGPFSTDLAGVLVRFMSALLRSDRQRLRTASREGPLGDIHPA